MNQDDFMLGFAALQIGILLIGLIGNTLLIIAKYKDPLKVFKNPSSMFIRNIAVIDSVVAVAWALETIMQLLSKDKKTFSGIWLAFATMSPLAFLCLAIERYVCIAFPLRHRVHFTSRICCYTLFVTWFSHILIFMLSASFMKNFQAKQLLSAYVLFTFVCVFCVYLATYASIRKQRKELALRFNVTEATFRIMKARQKHETRFLFTIAIVCSVLMITIMPTLGLQATYVILGDFIMGRKKPKTIKSIFLTLLSANFAINPIVYVVRLPKYRKTFKKLYFC